MDLVSSLGFFQYGAVGREQWLLVPTTVVAPCLQLHILGYVQIKMSMGAQMLLSPEVARKTGRPCHMCWKAVQQCRMSQFLFGKSSNGATHADLLDAAQGASVAKV